MAKRIDFKKGYFDANGKRYYINTEALTVGRYKHYIKLIPEITFGVTFEGMFSALNDIYAAVTSGNDILAANRKAGDIAYHQMNSIKNFSDDKELPTLLLCSMCINTKDEDVTKWSEAIANEKIADWEKEGIAIDDFFLFALHSIKGFRAKYLDVLQKEGSDLLKQFDLPTTPDTPSTKKPSLKK